MTDSPTWYDVLGVPRDAPADDIRVAWRSQIADLDPDDRRFDSLNRAAKVLLDPAAREAYDAAHPEVEEAAADEPAAETQVDAPVPGLTDVEARPPVESGTRTVPGWLLAGLALVAAGLVAATVWMWVAGDGGGDSSAARDAQVAAERAVVPVLSYDYEHLDEDQKAAQALMTGSYRKEYDKLFTVLEENAPETQTKVSASVVAPPASSARATDRVQVLVFVDRPTTNKLSADPVVYKDQVTLSMQLVDGVWLVDDMVTSPARGRRQGPVSVSARSA